jgi:quinol monooxygenase YgiN
MKSDSIPRMLLSLLVCLVFSGNLALRAQDAASPIVVVVHVDVMPPYTEAAVNLLVRLRRDSLQDAGERNFQVLQELGRPNHFTLVEAWADRAAYEAHNAAEHTRHFRDELQPMLGSPFDERLHTVLSDNGK